jgi:repressor LexA
MTEPNNINNRLRERRKELGLTMKEVASAVGVSEGTVSRWESGNIANMGRDKIYALSKILKMSTAEIMGIEDEAPKGSSPVTRTKAKSV